MNFKLLALTTVAAATLFVGTAQAQRVSIGFTQRVGHGAISVGIGDLFGWRDRRDDDRCERPYRVWTPGHYECRDDRVWVPGVCRRVWVAPVYEWRTDYRGCKFQWLVRDGYWDSVEAPGHYETRRVQVWVEGCWVSR